MTPRQFAAACALASISFAAAAQRAPVRPDPLDANATVPALTYESVFDTFQKRSGDEQPSADKGWRAANDAVAQSEGHGSHGAPAATVAPATAVAPVAPVAPLPTTPAPAKAPTSDHSKHH
jgi:hypothetical protein